jgi:hypothetical protein
MAQLYKIIPFKRNCGSCGGSLVQFQAGGSEANALPFEIGKVLVMSDIRTDDVRGNHAHYETEEILVALTGGCVVDLDDGRGTRESVRLSALPEDGGRKAEDGGQKTVDGNKSAVGTRSSVLSSQSSEIKALLLFPHIWRTMRDFEPGTTLMVVANIKYDEADYIRDRAEFERVAKEWNGLGGSSYS